MRAFVVQGGFGLSNLVLVERPDPVPGPGQVLVRMGAVSLNFRDLMTVRGQYNPRQPLPLIPCSDGAGEIAALGEGVEGLKVGDRVSTLFMQGWQSGIPTRRKIRATLGGPLDGALCELMVLDEAGVVPVPEHLTDVEAACLPCAALTAWSALVTQAGARAGDTVLVQGTGGVSIFALQFAKLLGARVIVTSSSDVKLARVGAMGADALINYKDDLKWGRTARGLAGGEGVDIVIEVGGAGTLGQSLSAVRPGGTVALIGVLTGGVEALNIVPILMQNIRVQGILVGSREGMEQMNRAIAQAGLRPVVDKVFKFEEAKAAFDHMASARHFGKICIALSNKTGGASPS